MYVCVCVCSVCVFSALRCLSHYTHMTSLCGPGGGLLAKNPWPWFPEFGNKGPVLCCAE